MPGYRPWPPLGRVPYHAVLLVPCPACGARQGQPCDGSRIPRWESLHFARRAEAERVMER